ncbi:MAG: hypothetical protein JWQ18_3833 [Conexibacter sp.]|nr:hypothetical protein [Conexibacter sp.]
MTLHIDRVEDWLGQAVTDRDGEKIGKLEDIVFAEDGSPLLGVVATGLLGRRTSLFPLEGATLSPSSISISYAKSEVKDAPSLDDPATMTVKVEDEATGYYRQPLREHAPDERYTTARERVRLAEEAEAADQRALALEQRAAVLGTEADQAAVAVAEAQQRAKDLAAQRDAAVAEATAARAEHAKLLDRVPR